MAYMRDETGQRLDQMGAVMSEETATPIIEGLVPPIVRQQHTVIPVSLASAREGQREYPTLANPIDAPIFSHSQLTGPIESVYFPSLVDLRDVGINEVCLLASSDHATAGKVGIWKAHAANPFSTFTYDGLVFLDTVDGTQTETPSVVGRDGGDWLVTYQQQGVAGTQSGQVSLVARVTADDFSSGWSRIGVASDPPAAETGSPSLAHGGYMRTYRWGGSYYAYGLHRGNLSGAYVTLRRLLMSRDGINWTADPRPLSSWEPLLTHIQGYNAATRWEIIWAQSTVVQWRGGLWWIGTAGPSTSGIEVAAKRIITFPLSDDFRRPLARPIDITPAQQSWMTGPIDMIGGSIGWDGRLIIPFRSGGPTGKFGIVEVV